MYVKWRTGGERFGNETWVQNYLQISDSEAVQTHMVMTCNAEYMRDNGIAENVLILNYYGQQSFRVRDNENDKTWDGLGILAPTEMEWFVKDENNIIPNNYLYEYKDRKSYQSCAAVAPMYSTVNGQPVDDDLNKKYFLAKDSTPAPLLTGFRIWDDVEDDEYEYAKDAKAVEYRMWDFGIEKPVEIVDDAADSKED